MVKIIIVNIQFELQFRKMEPFLRTRPGCQVIRFGFQWNTLVPFISITDNEAASPNLSLSPWFTALEAPDGCEFNLKLIDQGRIICVRPSFNTSSEDIRPFDAFDGPVVVNMALLNRNGDLVLSQMHIVEEHEWLTADFLFSKEEILQLQCQQEDGKFTFCCDFLCQVKTAYYTPTAIDAAHEVSEDFGRLFNSMESSDVIFNIRGSEFPAHRSVLSARCPNLDKAFKPNDNRLAILYAEPEVFRELLHFIYTGRVSLDKLKTMAAELYIAASQYEMTTLKEECKKYLIRHMSPEDCAELLLHANRVLDKDDFMRAAKYFWRNIGAVINTDKWKKENLECPAFIRVVQELLIHNKFFFTSA